MRRIGQDDAHQRLKALGLNTSELQQRMEQEVQRDPTNQPELRIDASPDSEYDVMAKVLAAAKNAQMKKIGFVQQ